MRYIAFFGGGYTLGNKHANKMMGAEFICARLFFDVEGYMLSS
jgi:hypothetical protein